MIADGVLGFWGFGFLEIDGVGKIGESTKSYLLACLWMSLNRIIVWTPRIPNFKSLG